MRQARVSLSFQAAFQRACTHTAWTCARISNAARDSCGVAVARACVRSVRVGLERARHGFARVYRAYESCDLAHALYACLHAPTVARLRIPHNFFDLFSFRSRSNAPAFPRRFGSREKSNICLWIFSLAVKNALIDSYLDLAFLIILIWLIFWLLGYRRMLQLQ